MRIALLLTFAASTAAAQSDSAKLVVLNRGYVDAFIKGDSAWYNANTTRDFECLCPDGSVIGKADFLSRASKPTTYATFGLDSVRVKLMGDVAAITAITPWTRPDGTSGVSRYTDIWVKTGGVWKAKQAQITPVRR